MTSPALTTLLVSYNTQALLPRCLGDLDAAAASVGPSRTIVVDNASADASVELLQTQFPQVELIRSAKNVGFGRANNLAFPRVDTPYLLLLNTDAFVPPDSLSKTLAYMESHPRCGILGVRLIGRDGVLQPSCRYFPTPFNSFVARAGLARWLPGIRLIDDMDWPHDAVRSCDWVPGCFYLIRREVIDQVGLFDPRFFLYFEEVDHCFAARRAGWDVVYYPDVSVIHLGGESAKSEGPITAGAQQLESLQIESALLYFRKNHGLGGLLGYVMLDMLADVVLLLRAAVKRQAQPTLRGTLNRIAKTCRLFARTRCGTRPTR